MCEAAGPGAVPVWIEQTSEGKGRIAVERRFASDERRKPVDRFVAFAGGDEPGHSATHGWPASCIQLERLIEILLGLVRRSACERQIAEAHQTIHVQRSILAEGQQERPGLVELLAASNQDLRERELDVRILRALRERLSCGRPRLLDATIEQQELDTLSDEGALDLGIRLARQSREHLLDIAQVRSAAKATGQSAHHIATQRVDVTTAVDLDLEVGLPAELRIHLDRQDTHGHGGFDFSLGD